MQFPKLTPLQSRFTASFAASLTLIALYLTFSNPHLVYAVDTDLIEHRDHSHPLILDEKPGFPNSGPVRWGDEAEDPGHQPVFAEAGRDIVGRAPENVQIDALENNIPGKKDILLGDQQFWSFSKNNLYGHRSSATADQGKRDDETTLENEDDIRTTKELRKRQSTDRMFYLTLNVCDQPSAIVPNPQSTPPQLTIYVSRNSNNKRPNPSAQDLNQAVPPVEQGHAQYEDSTSDDVYIGIWAPKTSDFRGTYNYELTISTDAAYTSYEEGNDTISYIDSDSGGALFTSSNLTDSDSTTSGPPFGVFVHNRNDTSIQGILRSYCGLRNHAQIRGNIKGLETTDVEVGINLAGGGLGKQQYHVRNLNSNSLYYAMKVVENRNHGPGNVNGGGRVWKSINFTTTSASNCQLIYNLTFCNEINYAVPSNPNNKNYSTMSSLANFYDGNASKLFTNFKYSLEQIPCNTTSSARYSLAVTCDDCTLAYKRWLCAVTIPRCADFSSPKPYLQARNVAQKFINGTVPSMDVGGLAFSSENQSLMYMNSSRNLWIDQIVAPGPYKEVLPCKELCYGLVRSCPASLGFVCPSERFGLQYSYGSMAMDGDDHQCNIPTALWVVSGSWTLRISVLMVSMGIVVALGISFLGI